MPFDFGVQEARPSKAHTPSRSSVYIVDTRKDDADAPVLESVEEKDFVHPGIDRAAAEALVLKDGRPGAFLARTMDAAGQYSVVVLRDGACAHLVAKRDEEKGYSLNRRYPRVKCDTLVDLINYVRFEPSPEKRGVEHVFTFPVIPVPKA